MVHLVLLLSSLAQAGDFYVIPIDPVQTLRSHEEGGAVKAALADLFGKPDKILVERSVQPTIEAFAEKGLEVRVDADSFFFPESIACVAEVHKPNPDGSLLGALMSMPKPTAFEIPTGSRWALHVDTAGSLKGWLGDLTGETMRGLLTSFREHGIAVAVCEIG